MKALFDQSPFPPLRLPPGECQRFERIASELLRRALDEYERFGPPQHRQLSKTAWKAVKSHENCTVYLDRKHAKSSKSDKEKDRDVSAITASGITPFDPYNNFNNHASLPVSFSSSEESTGEASSHANELFDEVACNWKNVPELVLSGAVPGTLDDIMYGMSAYDSAEVLLRTAYVDDHLLDGAVLQQIKMPTPNSPFRFLGIKWSVKETPGQYKKLVWPRDFLYLEASGTTTRPDGSRIGYMLRHPVDLAACNELSHRGVHRGRLAMSAIYTPLSNNTVDIFARGRVDLGGKVSSSLALTVSANALLSSASAVFCAHNKKLVWLLRYEQRNGGANPAIPVMRSNMFACGMCSKKFTMVSSVGTCRICCVQMCSRCRMNRSLSFVNEQKDLQVEQIGGVFCKNCIAHANQSSAFEVASEEVRCGRYGPIHGDEEVDNEERHQVEFQATRDQVRATPVAFDTNGHHHHPRHHSQAAQSASGLNTQQQQSPHKQTHQPKFTPLPPRTLASQRSFKSDAISSFSMSSSTSSSAPTVSFDSNTSSESITDLNRDSNGSSYSYCSDYNELEEVSGDEIGGDHEFREWIPPQEQTQHSNEGDQVLQVASQYQYQYHPQQQSQQDVDPNQQRQELWRKMTELRLQAESVYQLTKMNATMHMTGTEGSGATIEVCSDVESLD